MEKEIDSLHAFTRQIVEFFAQYSMQIVGAVIILILGFYASRYAHLITLKAFYKYRIDETLARFGANFVRFLVIGVMAIIALGKLGISIAPFVAALGALSLTAGLALQGSVANFAAGVVLIVTKPFKIGDTITIKECYGEVMDIKLGYTILINENKEQITIPNKFMIGDVLVNSFEYRIAIGRVGIAYGSDVEKAISAIKFILNENVNVSAENEAIVGIESFGDSSIDIAYRYWAVTTEYYKTQFAVNKKVFDALNEARITIPFPQREITIKEERIGVV